MPGTEIRQVMDDDAGIPTHHASLCVLSSSSSGNSTALVVREGGSLRLFLIDAGLSPRRTARLLKSLGLGGVPICGVLLTHLDWDHWYSTWDRKLPEGAPIYVHRSHRRAAEGRGVPRASTATFDGPFELCPGVTVDGALMDHDDLGAASFRVRFAETGRELGYATDCGRPSERLVNHLAGVDVLAIESNYCPRLQEESGRPWYLVRRIIGGRGHLSNRQCLEAVEAISPREHVVLLHLSSQCNTRDLAAGGHAGRPYRLTCSDRERPTPWVPVSWPVPAGQERPPRPVARREQELLWA